MSCPLLTKYGGCIGERCRRSPARSWRKPWHQSRCRRAEATCTSPAKSRWSPDFSAPRWLAASRPSRSSPRHTGVAGRRTPTAANLTSWLGVSGRAGVAVFYARGEVRWVAPRGQLDAGPLARGWHVVGELAVQAQQVVED